MTSTVSSRSSLNKLGWHVLRVGEHQVFGELDAVVARIGKTAWLMAARSP